jgi:phosphate-selective porin
MNQKHNTWAGLAATIFATGAIATNTHAQTSDAALNALIKKGILTEQEAKAALADLQKEKVEPKTSPFVLPLGKAANVKLGGFIQANGEFINPGSFEGTFSDNPAATTGHTPIHSRFRLRRARINVSGDFLENFDFKLEGDFSQSDGTSGGRTAFSGTDIFINWHQLPEANLKVGQYKAPFGLEQLTPDTTLFTPERTLVTGALTPERQIGVQLWGKPLTSVVPKQKDLFDYSIGIFNGNNRNTTINDDANFMYAGRISSMLYAGKVEDQAVKWRIGGNAFYSRYAAGTRLGQTGNLLVNNLTGPGIADGSLSGFNAPSSAKSLAWGVDQSFTFGPFDVVAEYLEEKVEPKNSIGFRAFTANGYYAQGSYYFPGKQYQLVAKWENFNPGQAAHDNIRSITGGLNYYIKGDYLKVMLDYIHTWSDYRHYHPGTGREQFDMVLARLQVMF